MSLARRRRTSLRLSMLPLVLSATTLAVFSQEESAMVFPDETWKMRTPEEAGLAREKLDALRDLVGGRGCVVHHGYMVYSWGDQGKSGDVASAMKPVISTLLLMAVQEGKLKSVDDP